MEIEEGVIQTPKNTNGCSFIRGWDSKCLEKEDESNPSIAVPFCKVNRSIVFRKPTNFEKVATRSSSYDADTQCDSLGDESDDSLGSITEEQAYLSEREYMRLMTRTFYLVKETKESRHKGLASPHVLRNKLYDLLSRKTTPVDPEYFFQECDYSKNATIRRLSTPKLANTKASFSKSFNRKSRAKTTHTKNGIETAFDSVMQYLTKMN